MYAVTQWPSWDADSVSAASACRPESIGQRCVNGASTRKLALTRTRLVPDARSFPALPEPQADYAYTLGLYLGDGCISRAGARDKDVWKLRIMCADAWPGLIRECARAMSAIRPGNKVSTQQKVGCTEVISCYRHWPCLFPQHGPGMKHMRTIELEPWQRIIVTGNPGHFARGLFHSDGYRGINRIRRRVADGERWRLIHKGRSSC